VKPTTKFIDREIRLLNFGLSKNGAKCSHFLDLEQVLKIHRADELIASASAQHFFHEIYAGAQKQNE
jgi:hypothetical protein